MQGSPPLQGGSTCISFVLCELWIPWVEMRWFGGGDGVLQRVFINTIWLSHRMIYYILEREGFDGGYVLLYLGSTYLGVSLVGLRWVGDQ